MTQERMKILLTNALTILEDEYECNIMHCDLEDKLGITQEEYDEIMNDTAETYYSAPHFFKIVKKVPARYEIWPIGECMGSDKYVPFCENDPIRGPYAIKTQTLLAVELPSEEVKLLRKAASCGGKIADWEEVLAKDKYCLESYVSREELKQAIEILKRIMEVK